MSGLAGSTTPGMLYVRALYDYDADDRTSLSFRSGDIVRNTSEPMASGSLSRALGLTHHLQIQVITQLESGWWDGVIRA